MAKTDNLTDFLTSLADKIREHTGETGTINPQDFEDKIDSIASSGNGGGFTVMATSPASDDGQYYFVKSDGSIQEYTAKATSAPIQYSDIIAIWKKKGNECNLQEGKMLYYDSNKNTLTLLTPQDDSGFLGYYEGFCTLIEDITIKLYNTCLTGDTLITLSDNTQKRIDQLTTQDKVLSYNPITMKLEPDFITYTDSQENKEYTEYDVWDFSNGSQIKTVHRHRFYNTDHQKMMYMDEWKIGEHGLTIDGKEIRLLGHVNIKEKVKHYTIFTKNQNYFANGILSGNRYTLPMRLRGEKING